MINIGARSQQNQENPTVLVLLAAFNGERWIEEQISTILGQERVQVKLLVSVDLSKDSTYAYVEKLAQQEPRVSVLPYGEVFGGAAPNFFRLIADADFAAYDFVSLADQDDIWLPNKLAEAVSTLQTQNADAYSSDVTAFWPNGKQAYIHKSQPQVAWDYLFEAAGPGCTYVLTKDFALALQQQVRKESRLIAKLGLHDWFIYAFARANRFKWVIHNKSFMRYRQHGNNQVGTNTGLKAFMVRCKKVLSGWAFEQSRLITSAIRVDDATLEMPSLGYGRMHFLRLAFKSQQCRRRARDQVVFTCMCMLLVICGEPRSS